MKDFLRENKNWPFSFSRELPNENYWRMVIYGIQDLFNSKFVYFQIWMEALTSISSGVKILRIDDFEEKYGYLWKEPQ